MTQQTRRKVYAIIYDFSIADDMHMLNRQTLCYRVYENSLTQIPHYRNIYIFAQNGYFIEDKRELFVINTMNYLQQMSQ